MKEKDAISESLRAYVAKYPSQTKAAGSLKGVSVGTVSNILNGRYRQVHVGDVRRLVEEGAYIVDVREEREYNAGHIKGAHNIPLSQLRQRMTEIPKDIPVYLHCRTSQRSYYALMYLQGNGYKNVTNISGSYLGISLYEYFNDKTLCRDRILTEYNFA